ncbi:MAG: DUF4038 domain-containing protein [Chitinophagales bacterium]
MNGRFLVDQKNGPFLIKEISAWGLIQALSEEDEFAFIDSVQQKGFNTLMVSIISYDTRFAGSPPGWQGILPFSVQWDFSTWQEKYFEHVDRFLNMAKAKNMLVLLVPCYLGYEGDKNQGWWDELLDKNNNPDKSKQYGQFLGNRYKGFTNIVWVAGGDNLGKSVYIHMNNIILGIKESDHDHLWTGHFKSGEGTNWSMGNSLYQSYIDINGLYAFVEENLGSEGPQYKTELAKYSTGKMIFQLDQSYEHDIPHGPDNEDYQWIRRKNYDGLLSGCAGTSFSPGQKDNQCYTFTGWRQLVSTKGMQEMAICFRLFGSRPWYNLVPNERDQIIMNGRGEFGSRDYVCAAMIPDKSCFMAYMPSSRKISINLGGFEQGELMVWWFDPQNGQAISIGQFSAMGTRDFSPPSSDGDWVLVIDKKSSNLSAPGEVHP